MESVPRTIAAEELLAQMGWVQSLARSLVRDPNVAADVAQQTWLTALERPPHTATSGPSLRAWLASVTRTLARQSVRSSTRRRRREHKASRAESDRVSTVDVVSRGEIHRELVQEVLTLDEPYRSTVLYRYLDGLSGPEIAERMGVSPAAVRKRLSRGLAAMRQRLDEDHDGDCNDWLSGFLGLGPLLGGGAAAGSASLGSGSGASGVSVGSGGGSGAGPVASGAAQASGTSATFGLHGAWLGLPLPAVVAGATLLLLAVVWTLVPEPSGAVSDGRFLAQDAVVTGSGVLPLSSDLGAEPLATTAAPLASGADDLLDTAALQRAFAWVPLSGDLAGRVMDVSGASVGGLRLLLESLPGRQPERQPGTLAQAAASGPGGATASQSGQATPTAIADDTGRFVFHDVSSMGQVLAASSRWVTVYAGEAAGPVSRVEPVVVVARRLRVSGRVVDAAGNGLPLASVTVRLPDDLSVRLADVMESSWPLESTAQTDASGRFEFSWLPQVPGAQLEVTATGYKTAAVPLPEQDALALTISLDRPALRLSGWVVDAADQPVAAALVSYGLASVRSDDDGAFSIWLDPSDLDGKPPLAEDWQLVAVAKGSQPAVLVAETDSLTGQPLWNDSLTLRLGPALTELSGQVVNTEGVPVPYAMVWVADPTVFVSRMDADLGSLVQGGATRPGARREVVLETVQGHGLGDPERVWWYERADEDGHFALPGLSQRPYTVRAARAESLVMAESSGWVPGDQVRLVLPGASHTAPLSGRVVSGDGMPLEGVSVGLFRPMVTVATTTFTRTSSVGETDATGSFDLGTVSRDGTYVEVDGPGLMPLRLAVTPGTEPMEVVLPSRCDVRVLLPDADEADQMKILDGQGVTLPLVSFRSDRRQAREAVSLWSGRSEVLSVTDNAATLVLLKDGQDIRRIPLQLQPGRLNEIR